MNYVYIVDTAYNIRPRFKGHKNNFKDPAK